MERHWYHLEAMDATTIFAKCLNAMHWCKTKCKAKMWQHNVYEEYIKMVARKTMGAKASKQTAARHSSAFPMSVIIIVLNMIILVIIFIIW